MSRLWGGKIVQPQAGTDSRAGESGFEVGFIFLIHSSAAFWDLLDAEIVCLGYLFLQFLQMNVLN